MLKNPFWFTGSPKLVLLPLLLTKFPLNKFVITSFAQLPVCLLLDSIPLFHSSNQHHQIQLSTYCMPYIRWPKFPSKCILWQEGGWTSLPCAVQSVCPVVHCFLSDIWKHILVDWTSGYSLGKLLSMSWRTLLCSSLRPRDASKSLK